MLACRPLFPLFCLLLAPQLLLAQQPHRLPTVGADARQEFTPQATGETWSQLEGIHRRLEALEAENAQLRRMVLQPGQPFAPSLIASGTVEPAGYEQPLSECGCTTAGCDGCGSCPDCGKQTCEGLPHLCAICLEKLSWNKAGGWRIVPFGRLRGEAIYSTAPQTGDAVIVFLNPNNPGVPEDQATVDALMEVVQASLGA